MQYMGDSYRKKFIAYLKFKLTGCPVTCLAILHLKHCFLFDLSSQTHCSYLEANTVAAITTAWPFEGGGGKDVQSR